MLELSLIVNNTVSFYPIIADKNGIYTCMIYQIILPTIKWAVLIS